MNNQQDLEKLKYELLEYKNNVKTFSNDRDRLQTALDLSQAECETLKNELQNLKVHLAEVKAISSIEKNQIQSDDNDKQRKNLLKNDLRNRCYEKRKIKIQK